MNEIKSKIKFEKKMIILIGNIGSGKTTYCKKLVNQGYIIVSKDALRYMLGNGNYIFDRRLEASVHLSEKDILCNFVKLGVNVVVDDCNVYSRLRKHAIAIGKSQDYQITAYILPKLSQKACVDRRMKNSHGNSSRATWNKVWDMFNHNTEEPSYKEEFDKIIYLRK